MFRASSAFDKLLDKATSHLLLEPDWNIILQLCDCIRQDDVSAKNAILSVKRKFTHTNPHVVLYALQVLESWVKNCGTPIHDEIATKQFMEEMKDLFKTSNNDAVKNKVLELIQTWAQAFRNCPNYRAVQDMMNLMKVEGYQFPTLKISEAMFVADRAPDWADGDCCHRCRAQFSMVQRKHHCRNCGQVFCSKCSSRVSSIPKFGIEKEVRVCDSCFDALNKASVAAGTKPQQQEATLPPEYLTSSLAQQPQVPPAKSEQELQEEEDLQLAIALSKSEAENKEKEKLKATSSLLSPLPAAAPVVSSAPPPSLDSSLDSNPELARYLNRSFWEQRHADPAVSSPLRYGLNTSALAIPTTAPSAPGSISLSSVNVALQALKMDSVSEKQQNGEVDDLDEFMGNLRSSLEIFVNRMKSDSSRGRHVAVDTTVQTLFLSITAMHSQLLRYIQEQEEKRVYYEGLQDKLSQARDARAALDALREEHQEQRRRAAEEAERQRQIQMAHKLEIMRKKKQEYLQYQRQIAMQRMQEQEREMQMRQEQAKQQYLRQIPGAEFVYPPQAGGQPQYQYPAQVATDSPIHSLYQPASGATSLPVLGSPNQSLPSQGSGIPPVTHMPGSVTTPYPSYASAVSQPAANAPYPTYSVQGMNPAITGALPYGQNPSGHIPMTGPVGTGQTVEMKSHPEEAELITFD